MAVSIVVYDTTVYAQSAARCIQGRGELPVVCQRVAYDPQVVWQVHCTGPAFGLPVALGPVWTESVVMLAVESAAVMQTSLTLPYIYAACR